MVAIGPAVADGGRNSRTASLTLFPRFEFRFACWCNAEYKITCRYARLTLGGEAADATHALEQRLATVFVPAKGLLLQLTAEHCYAGLRPTGANT